MPDVYAGLHTTLGHDITRQFLETYVDEMYVHDAQGRFVDVNQTACSNLGYTREELLGMHVEQVSELERATLEQIWARHTPGSNVMSANQHRRKDGSYYQLDVHITCLEIGGQKYFMGLGRRAEQRHTIEAQILQLNTQLKTLLQERTRQWRESSRMLEVFMEQTPDGVFIKDKEGRYIYVNPALLQHSGKALTDVLGRTDAEIFPSHVAQQYAGADQQALQAQKPVLYEERLPVGGRTLIFNVMKMPYRDAAGKIQGLLGMTRDITEMRMAQEQMAHNYAMLCEAERVAKIGSWTLNLTSNTFSASQMLAEMNGHSPLDPPLTPESLAVMIPADEHAVLHAAIARCMEDGTPYTVDVQHQRPGGGRFPARIRGQAFRNAQGQITMLHGTLQDLSDHVEANQRLQSLADNLPNGAIFRCEQTPDGKLYLRYVSAGIQRLLGISATMFVAQQTAFTSQIVEEDLPAFMAAVQHSLQQHTPFDRVSRVHNSVGQVRWLHARAMPRRTHYGMMWEGILLDVTAEYEIQESLRQAKEAAESAERAKSEFLATMSHEIRTPMNTVIGMTQLLLQTPVSPKQRNYLDKVALSASALLKIINEILDFSKLEAEKLQLNPELFTLDSLLATVTSVTSLQAEQKGVEVVYRIAPSVPQQLTGDLQRLGQVLTNLVGNAIKFTDRGEVVISVHAQLHDTHHCSLHVAVHDTGIGIHPEHMARLFEPFTQAEAHTSRRFGGTGLGLAISHKLVQLMGGAITAHSQLGQGSCFQFHVPLQMPADAPVQRHTLSSPCRVLVVDDNSMAGDTLCAMVQAWGWACTVARSGEAALEQLDLANHEQQPYELVLLDWQMPGMDGLQVAEHIRTHAQLSHTPAILMVTAYGRDEVLGRVQQLGLQGLLIKPVTESSLFNAMQEALSQDPSTAYLHGADTPPPSTSTLHIPSNLKGRRVLVVDDNGLNREVAQDILELAQIQVTTASSGQEALYLLNHHPFDAVLLDVQMPQMDGLEVARRIRKHPTWQSLPIWALTAQTRAQDHQAVLDSGMHGQLTKPINAQVLLRTLAQALPPLPAEVSPPSSAIHPADTLMGFARHFQGRSDRLQRLLRAFVRDFAQAPSQLRSLHHIQNWNALGELAHTLKGSLGYLDQDRAVQTMDRLNLACQHGKVSRTLVHRAAEQVQRILEHVQSLLSPELVQQSMLPPSIEVQHLLTQIAQAIPLVQRGEYTGIRYLEQVENDLRGSLLHGLAAQALSQAEDLETDAACQALQQLQHALRARLP